MRRFFASGTAVRPPGRASGGVGVRTSSGAPCLTAPRIPDYLVKYMSSGLSMNCVVAAKASVAPDSFGFQA